MQRIPDLNILAGDIHDRLAVVSFYYPQIHYNLVVKLLSDRYGVQARGGCACAGTYGHFLLDVDFEKSRSITEKINTGDLSDKPGWIRLSLHPTMTNKEVDIIVKALSEIRENHEQWGKDYQYISRKNEFRHHSVKEDHTSMVKKWFFLPVPGKNIHKWLGIK